MFVRVVVFTAPTLAAFLNASRGGSPPRPAAPLLGLPPPPSPPGAPLPTRSFELPRRDIDPVDAVRASGEPSEDLCKLRIDPVDAVRARGEPSEDWCKSRGKPPRSPAPGEEGADADDRGAADDVRLRPPPFPAPGMLSYERLRRCVGPTGVTADAVDGSTLSVTASHFDAPPPGRRPLEVPVLRRRLPPPTGSSTAALSRCQSAASSRNHRANFAWPFDSPRAAGFCPLLSFWRRLAPYWSRTLAASRLFSLTALRVEQLSSE